jgi:bifunctional DNA-binding transcriptional regulator/antitoxin component of YhaV-PrlF toxin-antitoxin module
MLCMGETTIAQLSNPERKALRSTIPNYVVKALRISKGDKLDWEVIHKNEDVYVIMRKVEREKESERKET